MPGMNKAALLLACALLAGSVPAWADIGRDDAAAVAARAAAGRVLSVERGEVNGRPVWRVKVVTAQGEVRVIFVDVASGRIV